MYGKVGVLILHGVGVQDKNYSIPMQKGIQSVLSKIASTSEFSPAVSFEGLTGSVSWIVLRTESINTRRLIVPQNLRAKTMTAEVIPVRSVRQLLDTRSPVSQINPQDLAVI